MLVVTDSKKAVISDQAKRLRIIFDEWSITQPDQKRFRSFTAFAEAIGIGRITLYYQLKGKYPVSKTVIDFVCYKLGYHPEWVINGKGEKKAPVGKKKMLTEVQQLKVKIDILEQYIFRLEYRMQEYENKLK